MFEHDDYGFSLKKEDCMTKFMRLFNEFYSSADDRPLLAICVHEYGGDWDLRDLSEGMFADDWTPILTADRLKHYENRGFEKDHLISMILFAGRRNSKL